MRSALLYVDVYKTLYTINFDWVMKLMMLFISGLLSISFLIRMAASCGLMLA